MCITYDGKAVYLYALMVGRPLMTSPMDEYTGEREMESSLFTSRTLACIQEENSRTALTALALVLYSTTIALQHYSSTTVVKIIDIGKCRRAGNGF